MVIQKIDRMHQAAKNYYHHISIVRSVPAILADQSPIIHYISNMG